MTSLCGYQAPISAVVPSSSWFSCTHLYGALLKWWYAKMDGL